MSLDWSNNTKTLICNSCPYADGRDACLVAGLPDRLATITFVLEKPQERSAQCGVPLRDRDGRVFKHILQRAQERGGDTPPYQVLYAVGKPGHYKPSKKSLTVCGEYVEQKLVSHREQYAMEHPGDEKLHVIVPLGAKTSRTFLPDLKNINKGHGKAYPTQIQGHEFYIVPTLGLSHVSVQPGIAPMMVKDIAYALKLCRRSQVDDTDTIQEITSGYWIPQSEAELRELTDHIINYTDPEKRPNPEEWPIAVDTETNSLDPWRRDSEVLVVSIAWDDRKSTAICLHHPESPYSVEAARECLTRILSSKKPKIFHNMKFDYQFLTHCEGFEINNLWWDTLLCEHFLDEDKKGYYNLDALSKSYCNEYDGYKGQIQESLIEQVKNSMLEGIDQVRPDPAQSYLLAPFFPDIDYSPACEVEDVQDLLDDDKLNELFSLEREYIEAHDAGEQKKKSSARGKVRRRCKKWGVTVPNNAKSRNYEKELDGDGYENVPYDVLLVYAATDTDVTRIICKKQIRRVHGQDANKQLNYLMRNLMVPGSVELGKMEFKGTYAHQETISESHEEIKRAEDKHLNTLRNLVCDDEFNPDSDVQLGAVVSRKLPVDPKDIELTDQDKVSVVASWIKTMKEKYAGTPQGEFLENLLVYRACTRGGSFLEKFTELSAHDKRLHPTFWLNGTKTGRLSCSNPNLQQVPMWMVRFPSLGYAGWNIKQPITVENPDTHAYWQMDISQAEIRVLCAYSQDPDLIEAMCEGMDVHSFITAKVFEMEYEEVYQGKDSNPDIKHKRTACKRVVFGTLYGAGVTKIAEQIYGTLSDNPHEREQQINFASGVRNTLFTRFPRIRSYVELTKRTVYSQGYVETKFGRRRRFQLRDANSYHRYKAEREAVNFLIQSTSSDIVLSQLIEVNQNIDKLNANMLLTVHDSMGGEVPLNQVHKMKDFFDKYVVERVKEKFPWLPVPFAYDLEVGPSYGEPIDFKIAVTPVEEMTKEQHAQYDGMSDRKKEFHRKLQAVA